MSWEILLISQLNLVFLRFSGPQTPVGFSGDVGVDPQCAGPILIGTIHIKHIWETMGNYGRLWEHGRMMMMMMMVMVMVMVMMMKINLLCIWVSGFSWYQPTLSSLVELIMKGWMQARMLFHLIILKSTF